MENPAEKMTYRFIVLWVIAKDRFHVGYRDANWYETEQKAREMGSKYIAQIKDYPDGAGYYDCAIQQKIEGKTTNFQFMKN